MVIGKDSGVSKQHTAIIYALDPKIQGALVHTALDLTS